MTKITLTQEGTIGILCVSRPEVHNALDWETMEAFSKLVKQVHNSQSLRALILTGQGSSFISGGDLKELAAFPKRRHGLRLSRIMSRALERLKALPMPTIAAINGPARGGGAEIAVACDLRVMSENADIGFVHSKLGITTAWGGARYLLQLIGYSRAIEVLTTGRVIKPLEALEYGLTDKLVEEGRALTKAKEIARQMAEHPKEAVQAAKRLLRFAIAHPSVANLAERQLFASLWDSDFRRNAVAKFLGSSK